MEGIVLNNLGVAYERLGQKVLALDYYQQSQKVYEETGNEPRAAEEETNAAGLLIDYGSNQPEALRRLLNARAMFQKLGNVEFELLAMEFEAASALHAGRHQEARRQLLAALSIARDRKYSNRVNSMTVKLAESFFSTSEYDEARKRLEEITSSNAGRDDAEAAVALGRVYVRLGDFDTARKRLESALAAIEAKQQLSVLPGVHLALGELEYESGKSSNARTHFEKAASFWTDDLPDAASVEAACDQEAIDPQVGNGPTSVMKSVEQARRMGRLASEAVCRLVQARIDVRRQQYANAIKALDVIPTDDNRTIGAELEARIRFWRSIALAAQPNVGSAESEAARARSLAKRLQASLPESYRQGFASRLEIRRILEENGVRVRP
jgi:tetratricopeptide (TPR) repeat protein